MSTVLVVGSTGNVGAATVRSLVAKGITVRAGCRNVESDKAKALAALDNVEVVHADMNDEATITTVSAACTSSVPLSHLISRGRGSSAGGHGHQCDRDCDPRL